MINSAVKITGTTVTNFDDVNTKDWFAEDVKHAQYAGYIQGYEDNTFRPNNPITRQEAAVILSRIVLPVSGRADLNQIAEKGYMKGDTNNNVTPTASLTRGQAAKLICEFVKNENIVTGVVEIKKGQTISQTLFTDGVTIICEEDAEIVLEDCRILGDVEVKSGMIVISLGNTLAGNIINH